MEPMPRPDAFTVGQINEYVRSLLEHDLSLCDVWVSGEVSGAKAYPSGHLYFSLKDETSVLSAVMFRSQLARLPFRPENGMRVLAHGRVSVYTPRGSYQLIADRMVPEGAGALAAAFEQLKARLGAEGLFDRARKKPLPPFPKRVGVVTSPSGAAVHDVIRVARRRFPAAEILIFPSLVQGAEAAENLRGGIRFFNRVRGDPERGVDLVIIGRGGGSAEDLWAFNDERLARAVAGSALPVVSAVGHETDFTICDFVADARAATPSAAAELVFPDRADLSRRVEGLAHRLTAAETSALRNRRARLSAAASSRVLTSPEAALRPRREALTAAARRLSLAADRRAVAARQTLGRLSAQLEALSPLSVLSRGYALVRRGDGRVVPSARALGVGDRVTLRFADGTAGATVTDVPPPDADPRGADPA